MGAYNVKEINALRLQHHFVETSFSEPASVLFKENISEAFLLCD